MKITRASTRRKPDPAPDTSSMHIDSVQPGGLGDKHLSQPRMTKKRKIVHDDSELYEGSTPTGPIYMATDEQAHSARVELDRRLARLREIKAEIRIVSMQQVEMVRSIEEETEPSIVVATQTRDEHLRKAAEASAEINRLIAQRGERIANTNNDFDSQIKELTTKHTKLASAAFTHRSTFAPIRCLPPETLGIIFEFVVQDGGKPKDLVLICHSWSRAAFAAHSIWSDILITNAWPSEERAVASLNAALKRAGCSVLLDITIDRRWCSYVSQDDQRSFFSAQYKIIATQSTRWRSLTFSQFELYGQNYDLLRAEQRFPKLQSLNLVSGVLKDFYNSFIQRIADTATNLTSIRTTSCLPSSEPYTKLVQNVKYLHYEYIPPNAELSKHMSQLEETVVVGDGCNLLIPSFVNVTRLRAKDLNVERFFSTSLDRLHSLVLVGCHHKNSRRVQVVTIPKYRINMPQLKSLTIIGGGHHIVSCFDVPNVDYLEIRGRDSMEGRATTTALERIWSTSAGSKNSKVIKPKVLKIDLNVTSMVLLKVLQRLPQLEELFVTERWNTWELAGSFFTSITRALPSSKRDSLLPKLKVFVVHSSVERCKKALEGEFQALETYRREKNSPMSFAACIPSYGWTGDYDAEETLE